MYPDWIHSRLYLRNQYLHLLFLDSNHHSRGFTLQSYEDSLIINLESNLYDLGIIDVQMKILDLNSHIIISTRTWLTSVNKYFRIYDT